MLDQTRGSFEDFLAKLLAVESRIDPASFAWYVREYESPVMSYPPVAAPGRVIRDRRTGRYRFEPTTVAQFFKKLGVDQLFDPASAACMGRMQYAATNALGFIGYQFGEAMLIDTGYYRPEVVRYRRPRASEREYDAYYVGSIPDAAWRGGRTEVPYRWPGTDTWMLATDVNRWRGTFTGKNGVFGLEDLKDPKRQELVMRDCLDANHRRLEAVLAERRGGVVPADATWSGLLAAAHLCGPGAAAAFVLRGTRAQDEFHTDIRAYLDAFGGFDTPYDS